MESKSLRPSKGGKIDKISDLIVIKGQQPSMIEQTIPVYSEEELKSYVDTHRYNKHKKPPEHAKLLYQSDEEIGSRSNILAVTGRAKSRKSAVVSAILSSMLSPEGTNVLGFKSTLAPDDKIIHVDTEQSQYDYWDWVNGSIARAGDKATEGRLDSIYARDADIDMLIHVTEYMLRTHNPRVAILDGVADYILDINNHEGVSKLGRKIMKWSTDYDALVIVVIHTTKTTGYMTGALGTWFEKKAETVIKCDKPDDQQEITNVSCQYARKVPFKDFTIMWDHITKRYEVVDESKIIQPQGPKNYKDPGSYGDDIHDQVLQRVFLVSTSIVREQLVSAIGTHASELVKQKIGKGIAERWANYYRDKTRILQDPQGNWSRLLPIAQTSNKLDTNNKPPGATDDLPF